jgi:hypothetical protein
MIGKQIFARDLQDRLGILALLALSAPFRICKLQIPLARRETDPVSGHHISNQLENSSKNRTRSLPAIGLLTEFFIMYQVEQ